MTNKEKNIIQNIVKNVLKKNWSCVLQRCNESAVNSHLLQENGILNQITEDKKLFEVKPKGIFQIQNNHNKFEFKEHSLDKAISLPLFCHTHDDQIFKSLESGYINFDSYKTFLLFSYRTIYSELRKKEMRLDIFNRITNANSLPQKKLTQLLEERIAHEHGINDINYYIEKISQELDKPNGEFEFKHFSFDYLEAYASAIFSKYDSEVPNPKEFDKPLKLTIVHVIPFNNKTHILIGYLKENVSNWTKNYIDKLSTIQSDDFKVELSKLFLTRIESWGVSSKIYSGFSQDLIRYILSEVNKSYEDPFYDPIVKNIFN